MKAIIFISIVVALQSLDVFLYVYFRGRGMREANELCKLIPFAWVINMFNKGTLTFDKSRTPCRYCNKNHIEYACNEQIEYLKRKA